LRSFCKREKVLKQHCNRDGADAAGDGGKERGNFGAARVGVARELAALLGGSCVNRTRL